MSQDSDDQPIVSVATAQWATVVSKVIKVDEARVQDCKEEVDTLIFFAGLLSVITSVFLIESYKGLQPDSGEITNTLLAQIIILQQNSSATLLLDPATLACTITSSCEEPRPPLSAKRVNVLWSASLILSLMTASFGMLIKHWLREFLAGEYTSPPARLRTHFFRYPGLIRWRVFELVAILPLLLQLSLALFFVGLCFFTWSAHRSVGLTSLTLVTIWVFLFALTTLSPLLSPRCPYKTTFMKYLMRLLRGQLAHLFPFMGQYYNNYPLGFRASDIGERRLGEIRSTFEEEWFAQHARLEDDLEILLAVDMMQVDDELFSTNIAGLVRNQVATAPKEVLGFIGKFMRHRVPESNLHFTERPNLYGKFTLNVWNTIVGLISDILKTSLQMSHGTWVPDGWAEDAVTLLLSLSNHQLPKAGVKALTSAFEANPVVMARLVDSRTPLPHWAFGQTQLAGKNQETDVFAELAMREIQGVLQMLHGEALLQSLLELLRCRFNEPGVKSIQKFFEKHPPASSQSSDSIWYATRGGKSVTYHVSTNGSLKVTLDILVADISRTFSTPCNELDSSIREECTIVFSYAHLWTKEQRQEVHHWLTDRRNLDWCIKLAFTIEEGQSFSAIGPMLKKALLDKRFGFGELRGMVDNMIDLLHSHSIAHVSNPSLDSDVKFACLHLCDFLLSLLNQELSEPTTHAIEEAKSYKGFLRTLKRLDKPLSLFLTIHHSDTLWKPELVKTCSDLCTTYNEHSRSKDVGTMNSVLDAINRKTTVEKAVEMLKRGIPSESLPQSSNTPA